jgi:AraC-like DNA-binding protein
MSILRHTVSDEPHFLVRSYSASLRDGAEVPPHAHAWPQLIHSIRGVMTVWTERGSWIAPPSWAIWAPAGLQHGIRFAGAAEIRTIYLRPGVHDNVPRHAAVIRVSPLLRELTLRAVELGMLDDRVDTHRAMALLIATSLRADATAGFDLPMPRSAALLTVARRLQTRLERRESVALAAAGCHMSVRTFQRAFLDETGMAFGRWRRHAMLIDALRLLAAGGSVKSAAARAGFRSASAFVVSFRTAFGTTPGQYFASESR